MDFEVVVNANTIIGFVGLLTALGVLFGFIKNYFHQVEKWNGYDEKIQGVNAKIDESISGLKEEQKMQTRVLFAVLDGLHQQGCNGEVTKATNELKDYLNENSHK